MEGECLFGGSLGDGDGGGRGVTQRGIFHGLMFALLLGEAA